MIKKESLLNNYQIPFKEGSFSNVALKTNKGKGDFLEEGQLVFTSKENRSKKSTSIHRRIGKQNLLIIYIAKMLAQLTSNFQQRKRFYVKMQSNKSFVIF